MQKTQLKIDGKYVYYFEILDSPEHEIKINKTTSNEEQTTKNQTTNQNNKQQQARSEYESCPTNVE